MNNTTHKGFTVLELTVVVGVSIILVLGILAFQAGIFSNQEFIRDSLSVSQDLRSTLKVMGEDIRPAAQANTGSYVIGTADEDELLFYSDVDRDGLYERIRYFFDVDGTTLKKGVVIPTGAPLAYNPGNETEETLATNISTTSIFMYYDNTFTGTSSALTSPFDIADIRMIEVRLTGDVDPNRPPGPITDESKFFIRSLKDI